MSSALSYLGTKIKQHSSPLSLYFPFISVLLLGIFLIYSLADKTVNTDIESWLETAQKLYATGDTGWQHRNILYSYIATLPLFLGFDSAIFFGLIFSAVSLLLSSFFIYKLNLPYSSPIIAAYVSLLFIISYPFLRYGSRAYTDIPSVLFLVMMVYFQFKFWHKPKPLYLCMAYFMASTAISLRYACAFILPAFLYYVWITKKYYKWHLLGMALTVIPYMPQLLYNINYLGAPIASSYDAARDYPTFSWRYFIEEKHSGYYFQILLYLQFLFLDFRGLFVLLTPICIFGMVKSFKRIDSRLALYLLLFFGFYIFLLSFYFWFINRYAIPALIPCFIWLAIGIAEIYQLLKYRQPSLKLLFSVALLLLAYGIFEISFQLIQSSRSLQLAQEKVFTDLNQFVDEGDVVFARFNAARFLAKKVEIVQTEAITPEMIEKYQRPNRHLYTVLTERRYTSEGENLHLSVEAIQPHLVPLHTVKSADVIELVIYRLLRLVNREKLIPSEEWVIYKIEKKEQEQTKVEANLQNTTPSGSSEGIVEVNSPEEALNSATKPAVVSEDDPDSIESSMPVQTRALWSRVAITGRKISQREIDELVAKVDRAHLNVILFAVYTHGTAYFEPSHTRFPNTKERLTNQSNFAADGYSDALSYLLAIRDKRRADNDPYNDFEVHAWFNVHVGGKSKEWPPIDQTEPYMLNALFPEFKLKFAAYYEKNDERFVDHQTSDIHQPKFRAYMTNLIAGLVEDYAVDGVHLDHIRMGGICYNNEPLDYPGKEYDFPGCQEDYQLWTRETYGKAYTLWEDTHGFNEITEGAEERIGGWQERAMGMLVRGIHDEVKAVKPDVVISVASVNNDTSRTDRKQLMNGQVAWEWLDQGWIDAIFVTSYSDNTQSIVNKIQRIRNAVQNENLRTRVFPGLIVYNPENGDDETWSYKIEEQVNAVMFENSVGQLLKPAANGLALFRDKAFDEADINILANGPFKEPALPYWGN